MPLPLNPAPALQSFTDVEPAEPFVPVKDGHSEQADAPVSALNVSGEHATGVPPFGPVNAAFATHAVTAVEPVAEAVPELLGQSEHASEEADCVLYLPATHAETLLPLPVYPAFARQSSTDVEAVSLPVPVLGGQLEQA